MNFYEHPFIASLWSLNIVIKALLLGIIVCRGQDRRFPFFTAYTAFSIVRSLTLYCVATFGSTFTYFATYWSGLAIGGLFVLGVMAELLYMVFRPVSSVFVTYHRGVVRTVVSMAVLTAIFAYNLPSSNHDMLMSSFRAFDRTVTVLSLLAFGWIAVSSRFFGLLWTKRAFGIAVGFLLYTSVDVAVTSVAAVVPRNISDITRGIGMIAFCLAQCLWVWYFASPEPTKHLAKQEHLERADSILRTSREALEYAQRN